MGITTTTTLILNNSLHTVKTKIIKFEDLWKNYPIKEIEHLDPTTKKDIIDNHCAINVSDSLYKCGIMFTSFKGTKCWSCPSGKSIHILRAQEHANWLNTRPFPGCPVSIHCKGGDFKIKLSDKTGIIFFKDYWQRDNESGTQRTGDHIDLWKSGTLASSGTIGSFIRITMGISIDGIISDFERSTQVLFWEIK